MQTGDEDDFGPSRDELLALTPDIYLANGYRDAAGQPRPELRTTWATAASTQLAEDEVAVQELAFTYEALHTILPQTEGQAPARAKLAMTDALGVVKRMIGQDNNEGLVIWLEDCLAAVHHDEDLAALLQHMLAVLRLYSVIAAFGGDDEPNEASPPSPAGSPS
jgi:hypothetical protein